MLTKRIIIVKVLTGERCGPTSPISGSGRKGKGAWWGVGSPSRRNPARARGNKRGPRRVERGRQWARRHNLCLTAQKLPAFPSRLTRGGPQEECGLVAIGTCGVVEPDGDLSQANKAWPSPSRELAASPERYGAGELLFLACRDDLPALLRSGADAAAAGAGGGVRVRRGRCFARDWRICGLDRWGQESGRKQCLSPFRTRRSCAWRNPWQGRRSLLGPWRETKAAFFSGSRFSIAHPSGRSLDMPVFGVPQPCSCCRGCPLIACVSLMQYAS
jgi:hypothetical protein